MFDQQPGVVDIFAETEKPAAPGAGGPSGAPLPPPPRIASRGPSKLLLGGIVLAVIGFVVGGYFLYATLSKPSEVEPIENVPVNQPPANTNTTNVNAFIPQPQPEPEPVVNTPVNVNVEPAPEPEPEPEPEPVPDADTDADGLSDEEEAALGTDPQNADTDNDGLSDSEEVKIYSTDPKNPDTDRDAYMDGDEVKGGYNPNGPGRLFTVPGR